jgi:hypothetical protein
MRNFVLVLLILSGCIVVHKPGPPPHAPAYGYRAKYIFWYYPCCEIYYHPERKVYIIFEGGNWIEVKEKPKHLISSHYVIIETDNDKPWNQHDYYKKKYPPKKGKKR